MDDLYFSDAGDITRDASGDIAMTDSPWRDGVQQVYIRCMTDIGDFLLYPTFGANLSALYGMPQSSATGDYGISLITSALARENYFSNSQISVAAVPISQTAIRFDVYLTQGNQQQLKLSLIQNLSLWGQATWNNSIWSD